MIKDRGVEKAIAISSFASANAIAYLAFFLSPAHNIAAGVLTFIAQMLLLCATILGLDYKLDKIKKDG